MDGERVGSRSHQFPIQYQISQTLNGITPRTEIDVAIDKKQSSAQTLIFKEASWLNRNFGKKCQDHPFTHSEASITHHKPSNRQTQLKHTNVVHTKTSSTVN